MHNAITTANATQPITIPTIAPAFKDVWFDALLAFRARAAVLLGTSLLVEEEELLGVTVTVEIKVDEDMVVINDEDEDGRLEDEEEDELEDEEE